MNRRAAGFAGEQAACDFLHQHKIDVLEQNYQRRTGEIDIIAREKNTLLFIEVKRRSSLRYGHPAEAVDSAKRIHIVRTALYYLTEHGLDNIPIRFDIIEILPTGIHHIQNAFDATGIL